MRTFQLWICVYFILTNHFWYCFDLSRNGNVWLCVTFVSIQLQVFAEAVIHTQRFVLYLSFSCRTTEGRHVENAVSSTTYTSGIGHNSSTVCIHTPTKTKINYSQHCVKLCTRDVLVYISLVNGCHTSHAEWRKIVTKPFVKCTSFSHSGEKFHWFFARGKFISSD